MNNSTFFHDLQCRSGLGDRLLDLWAAMTVAQLHCPGTRLAVRWHEGRQFAGFTGNYTTGLINIDHCDFVPGVPQGALPVSPDFSHIDLNNLCFSRLEYGQFQLILRTGNIWGNTYPDCLHTDRQHYHLPLAIPPSSFVELYRNMAIGTKADPMVANQITEGIEHRVGVHIRLSDKIVPFETCTDMSEVTWRSIERDALVYLYSCIDRGVPLYVCSDDQVYKNALVSHFRSMGADVATANAIPAHSPLAGASAMVDFFALSRCSQIVQMTKYSTFSMAAALAGQKPLLNFFNNASGTGNRLEVWENTLRPSGYYSSASVA